MEKETILQDLYRMVGVTAVKKEEAMKAHTHTKTGGVADFLVIPKDYKEVQLVHAYALEQGIPLTVLGNASNVIVNDGGLRGIVVMMTKLADVSVSGEKLIVQSGAAIIDASFQALENKLTGLEFACGIPGTVGGAVYMNAGAYGGEVADCIESALVLTKEGELESFSKEALQLEYRKSSLSVDGGIVLETTFSLQQGDPVAIKEKMDTFTHLRETKQPLEHPSCGSVFKRPPGMFAGKLIQDSGLQGATIGGVQVSTKHAGFMVNIANGTATDYIELIHHVQTVVREQFGVQLETEVKVIGEKQTGSEDAIPKEEAI